MNKNTVSLAIGIAFAAAACGGSSAPVAPSRSGSAAPVGGGGLFGVIASPGAVVSSGDMGRCFQFRSEPACLSGARPATGPVVAGAVAPGAPGNFTATSNGSTVTLTWTAPTSGDPATSYVIEAGSSSGASNLANFSTGNTQTTFSTGGVAAGAYYVRVRARNGTGTSPASNEGLLVVAGTCTVPPGEPTALTMVQSSAFPTVTFSWTPGAYIATTYIIEAGSAPGLSDLAKIDLASAATTFTTTGVAQGIYYVRIRGKNACGTGNPSNETILGVGAWLLDATVSFSPGQTCANSGATQAFNGVAGQTVVVNVTGPVGSQPGVYMYDTDYTNLVGAVGGARGTNSLRVRLLRTGTYYPGTCDDLGVGGTFRITVSGH
jgi:hypothetical protein